MKIYSTVLIGVVVLSGLFVVTCSSGDGSKGINSSAANTGSVSSSAQAQPTPANKFTETDIAKLKWIEGDWRGLDGDKPFYERYKIEGSSLIVDSIKDETFKEIDESGMFELKNGEFGKTEGDQRAAASEISDKFVQFVPAPGSKGNMFRFEYVDANTWHAVLEMPSNPDPERRRKVYVMERWPKR